MANLRFAEIEPLFAKLKPAQTFTVGASSALVFLQGETCLACFGHKRSLKST